MFIPKKFLNYFFYKKNSYHLFLTATVVKEPHIWNPAVILFVFTQFILVQLLLFGSRLFVLNNLCPSTGFI